MPEDLDLTAKISTGSTEELLAARLATISQEASQSSAPSEFAETARADPFGGVPLFSEQSPTRFGEQSPPQTSLPSQSPFPTRESFDQTYLQSLINTGQSETVASIINASPKQQEAQLASAYQAEIARLQAAPIQLPAPQNALAQYAENAPHQNSPGQNALALSSQPRSYLQSAIDQADTDTRFREPDNGLPGLSRLPSFADELRGDPGEDFLQMSLSSRLAGQSLTEDRQALAQRFTEDRPALAQRFTSLGNDIVRSGARSSFGGAGAGYPEDDVLPDPLDLGYGDADYAQRRTLTEDSFSVKRGPSGFQRMASGAQKLMARAGENMREDFADPTGYGKLNYGYGLQQLGGEAGQLYEKTNSGNYLTPEEHETAAAGLLPGLGAIAGVAIGSMIAPGVGSWVGGMIGGGAGSAAQGVIGANEERAQASRQIGDEFTVALGEATSKLRDFSSQAEATGAPLKELQQVLGAAGSVAPLGRDAIAGAGAMTNALGEYAPANYASVAHQLKDPLVFGLAAEMGQNGRLSRSGYQSLGYKAAIEGDAEGLQQDNLAAERSTLADNPAYQAAQKRMRDAENPLGIAADVLTLPFGGSARLGIRAGNGLAGYRASQDLEENNPGDPTAKARAALFQEFGQIREDEGLNQALGSEAEAARTGIGLRGGSAADIAAGSAPVRASLQTQEGDIGKALTALRGQLVNPAIDHKLLDPYLNSQIADQSAKLLDAENKDAGLAREDYLAPIAEQGAAFSLQASRATYSGQSAPSRAGLYRAQEDFLTGYADNPGPLSPTERSGLRQSVLEMQRGFQQEALGEEEAGFGLAETRGRLSGRSAASLESDYDRQATHLQNFAESPSSLLSSTERSGLEENALSMRYGAKMATYTQALNTDDARIGEAALGVTQAKLNGTAGEVYSAQTSEIDSLTGKMRELTHQLSAGGLSADDFTARMRQRTEAEGQAAQVMAQRRDDRLNAGDSLASSQFGIDTAGLPHAVRTGGAGAADYGTLNRDFATTFAADQARINEFKPDDPRHRAAEAKLAGDRAGSREYEDSLVNSSPFSARIRTEGIEEGGRLDSARHAFERDRKNPFQDGDPENSPFTAYRKVEGLIDTSLARNNKLAASETSYRAGLQGKKGADGKPLWDDLSEEKYAGDMDHLRQGRESLLDERADIEEKRRNGIVEMLPEMIAGSPGAGRLTGIMLTPGMSAAYNSSPLINGSFGKPDPRGIESGEHHTAQAGGQVGEFLKASGIDPSSALSGATSGDHGAAILAELKRLNTTMERLSQMRAGSTGRTPVFSSANTNGVSPYAANGGR